MKRYIKTDTNTSIDIINIDDGEDYTMSFDDKMNVMQWLDVAESKIRNYLKSRRTDSTYYEVDDVSWGTDCFEIPIFKGDTQKPGKTYEIDKFRFCYDLDDVFERTALEQLHDAVDEFIDNLSYTMK